MISAQKFLLSLAALYTLFLSLLATPFFQNHILYLHFVRWPLFPDFANPAKYGLPLSRTLNVRLTTRDGLSLGSWLLLPPSYSGSRTISDSQRPNSDKVAQSLSDRPTVLFFHGNAATRAFSYRIQHYTAYAAHYNANVLAIDYRGYGDSEGHPSEEGLVSDARAAWDWLVKNGAAPSNILLIGHSLGTGVAAGLAAELSKEDIHPRGVVLLAPFTSIPQLLDNYTLFGILPILQPIKLYPPIRNFVLKFLRTQFNTIQALPMIKSPILLAHSEDDFEIPYTHSQSLFDSILEPYLPPAPPPVPTDPSELSTFNWGVHKSSIDARTRMRKKLVNTVTIEGFGSVQRLRRFATPERMRNQIVKNNDEGGEELGIENRGKSGMEYGWFIFVKAMYGGHDKIGIQHSLVDIIGREFFSSK